MWTPSPAGALAVLLFAASKKLLCLQEGKYWAGEIPETDKMQFKQPYNTGTAEDDFHVIFTCTEISKKDLHPLAPSHSKKGRGPILQNEKLPSCFSQKSEAAEQ